MADGDDEAESDDDRERIEGLEAIEHGEVDWDDDDAYSLGRLVSNPVILLNFSLSLSGRGQSWPSVDHLA